MSALERFHLDEEEFHDRHEMVISSFERGKNTLDEYLDRTGVYRARPFTREAFKDFCFAVAASADVELARSLAESNKYSCTINNESRELNLYRIEKFGLRRIFQLFVSSCFVGLANQRAESIVSHWRSRRGLPTNVVSSTIAL